MKYDKNLIYDWFSKRIEFYYQKNNISGKIKSISRNPIKDEIELKVEDKTFIFGEPTRIGKLNNSDYVFIYSNKNSKKITDDDEFYIKLKEQNNKGQSVDSALSELFEYEDLYIFFTIY